MAYLREDRARFFGARALVSLSALVLATAMGSACGGDDDGDGDGTAGSGGSGGSGVGGIGIDPNGGKNAQGGGDDGTGGDCGEPFEAENEPVNLLWVIDKSGSMQDNEIAPGKTRWAAMREAVEAAVEGSQESISYGLILYPSESDDECAFSGDVDVEVAAAADAQTDINAALAAVVPDGGTPTAAALAAALAYYKDGAGKDLVGKKYVLLATDGGPNCNDQITCEASSCTLNMEEFGVCTAEGDGAAGNCCSSSTGDPKQCLDDAETTAQVEALADAGISTIVVGIPGTETYAELLDTLAVAGGAPNPAAPPSYFAVEEGSASGLSTLLGEITKGLIKTCELQLAEPPADPMMVNVLVEDEPIYYLDPDDPDAGTDGWSYSDPATTPPTIVLKGAICETVETEGVEKVQVEVGCITYVEPK